MPDYQVATQAVLPLYPREFSAPLDQVGGPLRPDLPAAVQHWLVDSELYDAVRNGSVTAQTTA